MFCCGDVYFASSTSVYSSIHLIISCLLILFGILYLVFAEVSANNFIYAGGTLFTCIIIGLVFKIAYSMISCCNKIAKVKQLRQCKNFMIIGLGLMMVFGHSIKILIFFIGYDFYLFWSITTIFFFGITFSHSSFIYTTPCEILYLTDPNKFIKFFMYFHFVILVALCRVATSYSEIKDIIAIIMVQVVFCPCCMFAFFDFYKVLVGEIRVKHPTVNNPNPQLGVVPNAQVHPMPQAVSRVVIPGEHVKQKIDCKICLLEYSEFQVPRIMKECGHTVCEGCADHLLNYSNKKYLICPFCQMVTVVKGPASLLPKNYGLMDIIEDAKDE